MKPPKVLCSTCNKITLSIQAYESKTEIPSKARKNTNQNSCNFIN